MFPELSSLHTNGAHFKLPPTTNAADMPIPDDIENTRGDRYMEKLKADAMSIPYAIEPYSKAVELLDFYILRLTQSIEAQDFDIGFRQWDVMLTYWFMLKYPMPKDRRIKLAKLYFHLCTTPGMPTQVITTCIDAFIVLTKSRHKVSIDDMRLPWKPIYDILNQNLFSTRRQFDYMPLSLCMGYIAQYSRNFFHPAAINDMLSRILPLVDGTRLDAVLSSHYFLTSFLPLSHPQHYLPMLFRLWESINSYLYDERMLQFISKLAKMHTDPEISNPRRIETIPDDEISEGEGRPKWDLESSKSHDPWQGLYKDVGIFTEHQWNFLMCKCLSSMEILLADGGSLTTGPAVDSQVGLEVDRLPKPLWRIPSLARIVVYSMAPDSVPVPLSNAPTPIFSPLPSGINTPHPGSSVGDYLSYSLEKKTHLSVKPSAYLGGSKALDSLARMIASTESFFHPTNAGSWTTDLSAFIKYIVLEFNERWHKEQKPDCKTPKHRRLTKLMRRELVKSLRTVALLAMFSEDTQTVTNIQGCLKSMCTMEPDLILQPILERAVPSLEALEETQRTIAVIQALGAVAPAIVCRDVYYAGAKHLVPLLQLLIPGIDLNDPMKTLCTTAFLVEISQCIKIEDLTASDELGPSLSQLDVNPTLVVDQIPSFSLNDLDGYTDMEPCLSNEQEDALLKDSTRYFPDWVASFIQRVIQLLENLPDENLNGSTEETTDNQVVNAVMEACSKICMHLSDALYDMVLGMVFDYVSANVRPNAVRCIHQLVECVANADPVKTLAKFLPFCVRNIQTELENGASSLRTTSSRSPLPSDATLHWNLAILRGAMYNDGRAILKHENELIALIQMLHDKALSKRGYSWTGKLLSSLLLTLTHTYPMEEKFVNLTEWDSEEFSRYHHRCWGKLFSANEVTITWHVPTDAEIGFVLRIFKQLIEPTLASLEGLLKPGIDRNAVWRSDFCRHLTLVQDAFAGTPTLMRMNMTAEEARNATFTSDFIGEIPEMIANLVPLSAGFALTDPNDSRHAYFSGVRERFGIFLHNASESLRQQGEENTVDAVQMLVGSIRTYMLEYGDSLDSYFVNDERLKSAKEVAQQYKGQKVWPRNVYLRRARWFNSARLQWNSIERKRGPIEDKLIDDLVEWSLWHYPVVRQSSQMHLSSLCNSYDGVRRRILPVLFDALKPGTEDARMKGALWTINMPSFGTYAIAEYSLANNLISRLFGCQRNEKPSIQDCVSTVFENCLSNFVEPNNIIYSIPMPAVDAAIQQLKSLFRIDAKEAAIVYRTREKRIERTNAIDSATDSAMRYSLQIGQSQLTHWRYAIYAIRLLRSLVRIDMPLKGQQISYFLEKVNDDHPGIRYYAQRALMKSLRNLKLRSLSTGPMDIALKRNNNPLKRSVRINHSADMTVEFLNQHRVPMNLTTSQSHQLFCDKNPPGWLVWGEFLELYTAPHPTKSTFHSWEAGSAEAIDVIRKITTSPEYWEDISIYYSEENYSTTIILDNIACVKSIFQLLEEEPFEAFRPTVERLIKDKDQNKQRAAAELLAGVLGGSKHWPTSKQESLWKWFKLKIPIILRQNIQSDTLSIWAAFLEYLFYHRDPRRLQPLVDFLVDSFKHLDFNAELTFDVIKVTSLFRAFYEELGRKFTPWIDEVVEHAWEQIHGEHEDVRAFVGEILTFSQSLKWNPCPSIPSPSVFVKECQTRPEEFDIMGMRGSYHKERVEQLVENFKKWRSERSPGTRAFQSTYDRVGTTVCKWLHQSLHDLHAISTFDYLLPLMPEIFHFTELKDNNDLAMRGSTLLVRMCGVTPPAPLVNPILDAIFDTIQTSLSWRVRLKALPLVQVFYFRNTPLINEIKIVEILEVLCRCLDDEIVDVREMAATTLSGILRLSPRRSVLTLKDRFVRLLKNSHIPSKQDPDYNKAVRQRHAAILGVCALVDSYPYTVEKWMPDLLTNVLVEHTYDPFPISTTVRKCASNFKKTHQDTWHEDSKRFDEDQLAALSTLLAGSSYYA